MGLTQANGGCKLVCNSYGREVMKMSEEGKVYVCEVCGAEVEVIKKTVPDPKCPTMSCCEKEMKEKAE